MNDAKKTKNAAPAVSVIVPVYNSEKYLQACLDSLYAQTFQNFEIIAINDGSPDNSLKILQENARAHKNLVIIDQKKNHGQGYARNRALEQAKGKYVLFVDADDVIDSRLLEKTVKTAEADKADAVHFNWHMLDGDKLKFFNKIPFAGKTLRGETCEKFLQKPNYFVWDSLYRRELLNKYSVKFGEGYIYEDNEFIVQIASHANTIAIIDEPLYTMRVSAGSSTRSSLDSPRHYHDFMRAMRRSFEVLRPRTEHTSFYLAAYFLEKFIVYYQRRVPKKYRQQYLREFVDIMHEQKIVAPKGSQYRFLRRCLNRNMFTGRKYKLFYVGVLHKTRVLPAAVVLRSGLRKLQHK